MKAMEKNLFKGSNKEYDDVKINYWGDAKKNEVG